MAVQMELISSGGLPSPNATPLMNDLQTQNMASSSNAANPREVAHSVGGEHLEQQHRNSQSMYSEFNNSFHGLPTPRQLSSFRDQIII